MVCVGVGEHDAFDDEPLFLDCIQEGLGLVSAVDDPAFFPGCGLSCGHDHAVGLEVSERENLDNRGNCGG